MAADGVGIRIDLSALRDLERRLAELGGFDSRALLASVGSTVEEQTRRRIEDLQRAPDGSAWPAWSPRYAATRHGNQGFLQGEGSLVDSLTHVASAAEVEVGSNLVYAAVHQFGSGDEPVKVPAHQRAVTQAFGRKLKFPVWADVTAYEFLQNIPARPYLGVGPDDADEIRQEIGAWFAEILR